MSLKPRSSQPPSAPTTRREIEPLSEWTKANGRLPVACRQSWPMTPPWTTATALASGPVAATIRSMPAVSRAERSSQRSAPGITSQRSSAKTRWTTGSPRWARIRYSPPLELAEEDLAQLGDHLRPQAGRGGERRRGFLRASQAGDEDAAKAAPGAEPGGDHLRLRPAGLRERRVGVAVEQREGAAGDRRFGGPVADEDDLGRARRQLVGTLLESLAVGHPGRQSARSPVALGGPAGGDRQAGKRPLGCARGRRLRQATQKLPAPERRRLRIADAALAVLGESGSRGLTHRAVDEAADLPPGSTSNHFRTREALLEAAARRHAELDLPPTADVDAIAEPDAVLNWEQVRALLLAHLDRLLDPARPRAAHRPLRAGAGVDPPLPRLHEVMDDSRQRFTGLAEVLLRAGGCNDPDTHAPQLIAVLDGVMVDQLQETSPAIDRAGIENLLDRFLATCSSGQMKRAAPKGGPLLVHASERGNGCRAGQDPAPCDSPVPGLDSTGRPNQCGA